MVPQFVCVRGACPRRIAVSRALEVCVRGRGRVLSAVCLRRGGAALVLCRPHASWNGVRGVCRRTAAPIADRRHTTAPITRTCARRRHACWRGTKTPCASPPSATQMCGAHGCSGAGLWGEQSLGSSVEYRWHALPRTVGAHRKLKLEVGCASSACVQGVTKKQYRAAHLEPAAGLRTRPGNGATAARKLTAPLR